jgi:hypothetical protein
VQRDDAWPKSCRDGDEFGCVGFEVKPGRHRASVLDRARPRQPLSDPSEFQIARRPTTPTGRSRTISRPPCRYRCDPFGPSGLTPPRPRHPLPLMRLAPAAVLVGDSG